MGRYDNPLHVRVDTVSQSREALLHVAISTRGGVGLDRCPDGGQVSRKKDGVCQCTTTPSDPRCHGRHQVSGIGLTVRFGSGYHSLELFGTCADRGSTPRAKKDKG